MTILAARRVFPPDLMVPADASAPRMKLTGPDAVPPPASPSFEERILERFTPEPDPPLKIVPSSTYQFRIDDMWSSTARMKHAEHCCGVSGTPTLNHTGNSTFRCSKALPPSLKFGISASRVSHSISSKGCVPSVEKCSLNVRHSSSLALITCTSCRPSLVFATCVALLSLGKCLWGRNHIRGI